MMKSENGQSRLLYKCSINKAINANKLIQPSSKCKGTSINTSSIKLSSDPQRYHLSAPQSNKKLNTRQAAICKDRRKLIFGLKTNLNNDQVSAVNQTHVQIEQCDCPLRRKQQVFTAGNKFRRLTQQYCNSKKTVNPSTDQCEDLKADFNEHADAQNCTNRKKHCTYDPLSIPDNLIDELCTPDEIHHPLSTLLKILFDKGPSTSGIFRKCPNRKHVDILLDRLVKLAKYRQSSAQSIACVNLTQSKSLDDEIKEDCGHVQEPHLAAAILKRLLQAGGKPFFQLSICEQWIEACGHKLPMKKQDETNNQAQHRRSSKCNRATKALFSIHRSYALSVMTNIMAIDKNTTRNSETTAVYTLEPANESVIASIWSKRCVKSEELYGLVKSTIEMLSPKRLLLLRFLVNILSNIHNHQFENNMDVDSLAICTSSVLFEQSSHMAGLSVACMLSQAASSIFSFILRNCNDLFGSDIGDCFANESFRLKPAAQPEMATSILRLDVMMLINPSQTSILASAASDRNTSTSNDYQQSLAHSTSCVNNTLQEMDYAVLNDNSTIFSKYSNVQQSCVNVPINVLSFNMVQKSKSSHTNLNHINTQTGCAYQASTGSGNCRCERNARTRWELGGSSSMKVNPMGFAYEEIDSKEPNSSLSGSASKLTHNEQEIRQVNNHRKSFANWLRNTYIFSPLMNTCHSQSRKYILSERSTKIGRNSNVQLIGKIQDCNDHSKIHTTNNPCQQNRYSANKQTTTTVHSHKQQSHLATKLTDMSTATYSNYDKSKTISQIHKHWCGCTILNASTKDLLLQSTRQANYVMKDETAQQVLNSPAPVTHDIRKKFIMNSGDHVLNRIPSELDNTPKPIYRRFSTPVRLASDFKELLENCNEQHETINLSSINQSSIVPTFVYQHLLKQSSHCPNEQWKAKLSSRYSSTVNSQIQFEDSFEKKINEHGDNLSSVRDIFVQNVLKETSAQTDEQLSINKSSKLNTHDQHLQHINTSCTVYVNL